MRSRLMIGIVSIVLAGLFALPASAQNPRDDGNRNDRGGGGFGRGGGGFGGRGGTGPDERGPGGPAGLRGAPGIEIAKYEALRAYMEVVDRYSKLAEDPNAAGVAAVISASDLLRQRGPNAAIQFFARVLPDVSPQVERAIRIQLADLYKQSNQIDKALEQYDLLMRGITKGPAPTTVPAGPPMGMPPGPPPRP